MKIVNNNLLLEGGTLEDYEIIELAFEKGWNCILPKDVPNYDCNLLVKYSAWALRYLEDIGYTHEYV